MMKWEHFLMHVNQQKCKNNVANILCAAGHTSTCMSITEIKGGVKGRRKPV